MDNIHKNNDTGSYGDLSIYMYIWPASGRFFFIFFGENCFKFDIQPTLEHMYIPSF